MVLSLELFQWVVIVVLGLIVFIQYLFIASALEQIELLNDRMLRLLNDQEQRDNGNHMLERMRSWRGDVRMKSKL